MRTEQVALWSGGCRLAGTLLLPDAVPGPVPGIVQGPGWLGLRAAKLYVPYHEALTAAGFAVLTVDYRGFGDSEGDATFLDPMGQVADIRAGLDYLEARPEVDAGRLGVFGSGGTGGGNAIYAAATDDRVKAVVSQVPVSDGRDWLHRMRREHEWVAFLRQLGESKRRYAATGELDLVDPRDGIMVATPERAAAGVKKDVDGKSAQQVGARQRRGDPGLPTDRRRRPDLPACPDAHRGRGRRGHPGGSRLRPVRPSWRSKRLLLQTGTTHYAAYAQYRDIVNPLIVGWFSRHLVAGEIRSARMPMVTA